MQRRTMLVLLSAALTFPGPGCSKSNRDGQGESAHSLFQFSPKLLDGKPQSLDTYRGKVVLVVNTASQCRYTPQYEALEKLYQEYKDRGLVILAFPSNDFRGKEPGTASEIGAFCRTRYGVTFPLFDKVNTIEPDASPLYRFLAEKHGPPQWNFHKYLVGKNGQVLQVFKSEITPDTKEVRSAIEAAL